MSEPNPFPATALQELKQIVELAAFACEARRTLEQIAAAASHSPSLNQMLFACDSNHQQWTACIDSSAGVLSDVARRLGELLEEAQS